MIVKNTKEKMKKYAKSIFTYIFIILSILIFGNTIGTSINEKSIIDTNLPIAILLNIYVFILPIVVYLNEKIKGKAKKEEKIEKSEIKKNKSIIPDLVSIFILAIIPFLCMMVFEIIFLKDIFDLKRYIISFIVSFIYSFCISNIIYIKNFNIFKEEKSKKTKKIKIDFKKFKNEIILLLNILILSIYIIVLNNVFGFKTFSEINIIYVKLVENLLNLLDILVIISPVLLIYFVIKVIKIKEKDLSENAKNKTIINYGLIIILILTIILSAKYKDEKHIYMDLSKEKIYTLKKENKDKIKEVQKEIEIYYPGINERKYVKRLAENLHKVNKKIKYKDKVPELTEDPEELSKEYIYIVLKGKNIVYSISPDVEGKYLSEDKTEYKYLLEDKVVNGILKLNKEEKNSLEEKKASIAFGIPDEDFDLTEYKDLIGKISLKADKIDPALLINKIPDNIGLLIIPAINKDISDKVLKNLLDYGKRGGNFFIANGMTSIYFNKANKNGEFKNFNKFLAEYGIKVHSSDIFKREKINETLAKYQEERKDFGEPEKRYIIKADPIFEEDGCLGNLKNNAEKNEIFVASPIEVLKNKKDVNVKILAKTSKDSTEIKDREDYRKKVLDTKEEIYNKVLVELAKKEDLEKIFKEQKISKKDQEEILKLKKKKLEDITEKRFKNLPKYDEKEFNIITESNLKTGNKNSKMIYVSSDEIFYGKTSLNVENKTSPPILLVYNQRLIYDIYEYLNYGNIEAKKEDTKFKNIKEIDEGKMDKYQNLLNISALVIIILGAISLNVLNYIKLNKKETKEKTEKEKTEKKEKEIKEKIEK